MKDKSRAVELWRARILSTGEPWEGPLEAYWEVLLDAISDEYRAGQMDAVELLRVWARGIRETCQAEVKDDLVPISWYVLSAGEGVFERMPFQWCAAGEEPGDDFLTFYSWPIGTRTGERLNWLTLRAADKLWRGERCDKGGFIQEATGWKPSILQPFVYLPSLLESGGLAGWGRRA
jgi:hypothetical protein